VLGVDATDRQDCRTEADLIPGASPTSSIALSRACTHRIPMAQAISLGQLSKSRHLSVGQIFPRAISAFFAFVGMPVRFFVPTGK
jgi:hypothetical protein